MVENLQSSPTLSPPPQRRKRKNSALDSPHQTLTGGKSDSGYQHTAKTPSRRSKKVRFSDSSAPVNTKILSTGITPHLRRSYLDTPRRKSQRTPATQENEQLQFTPLRQILDDRAKRRIARNGLSEEMNDYAVDKKATLVLRKQIEKKDAELKKLKAELEIEKTKAKDVAEQFSIPPASQGRVDEVEADLEALRQSFAMESAQPVQSWNHVRTGAKGPASEGGDTIQIYEDEDAEQPNHNTIDADSLAMGLELEAARQAKKSFLGSFRESASFTEMNFADSPARRQHKAVGTSPRTPKNLYHDLSKQLRATTNRAEEAELALKTLEVEVNMLGFGLSNGDGIETVTVIADHFRQARLDLERTLPGESVIGFENAKVLPELITKLGNLIAQLRNKESDLKAAKEQQHNLKGNFEKAIVAAEKATSRVHDLEVSIDTAAEEMLNLRIRSQNLEKDLAEREKDITTLTSALDKYRADVSRLEGLITSLEASHASNMTRRDQATTDLEIKLEAETRGRRAAETSAVSRLAKISELESALSTAVSNADKVEEAMAKLQTHVEESSKTHNQEVGSLNSRINNLSNALASANAEVEKLKITKSRLEERVRYEVESGARAVESMQNDLVRSVMKANETKKSYRRSAKVRTANWEIESDGLESDAIEPMTPVSTVQFSEFSEEFGHHQDRDIDLDSETGIPIPSSVEIGRGSSGAERSRSAERRRDLSRIKSRSRRDRDSGIGMSPVSEGGEQDIYNDSGIMTPELSSEADFDMDIGIAL